VTFKRGGYSNASKLPRKTVPAAEIGDKDHYEEPSINVIRLVIDWIGVCLLFVQSVHTSQN